MTLAAACLLGLPLASCSRSIAPPVEFAATPVVMSDAEALQAKLKASQEACTDEARRKGISSVTRILLLRGKISKSDYVACMKKRGFEVPE